jgi:hypothetical protein
MRTIAVEVEQGTRAGSGWFKYLRNVRKFEGGWNRTKVQVALERRASLFLRETTSGEKFTYLSAHVTRRLYGRFAVNGTKK